jgi:hypothetical protein
VLSHRKARTIKSWDRVISAETGEIVNGFVKCRTKGGMIVVFSELKLSYQDLKLMLNQLEIMMLCKQNNGIQSCENQPRI